MTQGLDRATNVDLDQKTIKKSRRTNTKVLSIEAEVDLHHEGKGPSQKTEKRTNIENITKSITGAGPEKGTSKNINQRKTSH